MFGSIPLPELLKTLLESGVALLFPRLAVLDDQAVLGGKWRTRSLLHEKVKAGTQGWGMHSSWRLAGQPGSVAEREEDNACFIESLPHPQSRPSTLLVWRKICNFRLHFALRYRIRWGYYTVGLLQGCLSTAACSHKTQNGMTRISSLKEHKDSSFIQIVSLHTGIQCWTLLLHQHEISFQTIDLTFNNQYFPSTCSAFKVIHWTD